jgi:hypothetical protein
MKTPTIRSTSGLHPDQAGEQRDRSRLQRLLTRLQIHRSSRRTQMRNINRILVMLVVLTAVGGVGGGMGQLIATSQATACLENPLACQ